MRIGLAVLLLAVLLSGCANTSSADDDRRGVYGGISGGFSRP